MSDSSLAASMAFNRKLEKAISSNNIKILIRYLVPIAVFFLIFRTGYSIKAFDFIVVIIGIFLSADGEARRLFLSIWPRFLPYARYFFTLIVLIVIAQTLAMQSNISATTTEAILNFARLIFNVYVFFLTAFLIYYDKKSIVSMCWAIFLSPVVVLPAYWDLRPGVYISGGRLTGFLQTPIVFGFWMAVVFLIGIGLYMISDRTWKKIGIALWLIIISSFVLWAASRAAWIAAVAALGLCLFFYVQQKNWPKLKSFFLISVLTIFLGYPLLPYRELKIREYVEERVINLTASVVGLHPTQIQSQSHSHVWPDTLRFIVSNPFGLGFGSHIGTRLSQFTGGIPISNSSFLEVALYGGIGGLLLFLIILIKLLLGALRTIKSFNSSLSDLALVLLILGVVAVVDIAFTDAFLWRHIWFVLGMVLGISLSEGYGPVVLPALAHKPEDKSRL